MEAGTPYFIARDKPCEMCPDIPCMNACPSGALSEELKDINDARMGLAVLLDQETCLNWQGLRCDVCYRVCPLVDKAITLERVHNDRTGIHAKLIPCLLYTSPCPQVNGERKYLLHALYHKLKVDPLMRTDHNLV